MSSDCGRGDEPRILEMLNLAKLAVAFGTSDRSGSQDSFLFGALDSVGVLLPERGRAE